MQTPFADVTKRFLALSDLAEAEYEAVHAQIMEGQVALELGSPEGAALMAEPLPCADALQAFLGALPDDYVHALVTLMYSGRDGNSDALSLWASMKQRFADDEFAIEFILDKSPRAEYIKRGIEHLAPKMPLNDLPAALAAI